MTRAIVSALFLAIVVLAFMAGRSSATPRPGAQSIPASVFEPVHGGQATSSTGESDPERRTRAAVATDGAPPSPEPAANPPSSRARAYALRILGPRQYACLDAVVRYESGWRLHAVNRVSGAYGWFQAFPASKLDRWGRDAWGQMRFGLAYIASRYGTACRALGHIRAVGWF